LLHFKLADLNGKHL